MSSGGSVIKKHTYDYNLAGWKTDHTIYTGGTADRDYLFDYDDIGQLEFADDANTTLDDFEYVYDEAWNLDERFVDETSENFTVDNLNQLTSHSAAYDDNGNIENQGTGSTLETYTYNAENQLVSVRYYTSYPTYEAQIDFTYDGLRKSLGSVLEITVYVRCGDEHSGGMAWPLRIEFSGAIYHVTSRMLGSWRQARDRLFRDERDHDRFLKRLSEGVADFGVRLYLFTLMTNHYHLVLETPEGNLSRFMQWLSNLL